MIVLENSFINFIYPFVYDAQSCQPHTFISKIKNIFWQSRQGPANVWEECECAEDEILPCLKSLLTRGDDNCGAYFWKIEGNALQSPFGFGGSLNWHLLSRKEEIPFKFEEVKLGIFSIGIGFIIMRVCLLSSNKDSWLDFLYNFRFCRGQRNIKLRVTRQVEQYKNEPYWPGIGGDLKSRPNEYGNIEEIIDMLLYPLIQQSGSLKWWQDIFIPGQLIPFACILLEGQEQAIIDELLNNELAEFIYRIKNLFHSRQEIRLLQSERKPEQSMLRLYSENQWFAYSLDGTAFIAYNPPKTTFFLNTLPSHIGNQYFLVYLLVLSQHFILINLSNQVSRYWIHSDESKKVKVFRIIKASLLEFTARLYFTQVIHSNHQHIYYSKWQDVLQITCLYNEVKDEVFSMHNEITLKLAEDQYRRTKRLELMLLGLGSFIGIPALCLNFMIGMGENSVLKAILFLSAGLFLGAGFLVASRLFAAKKS
jgi:hypothetical protein